VGKLDMHKCLTTFVAIHSYNKMKGEGKEERLVILSLG
jgi:hypothetical protein